MIIIVSGAIGQCGVGGQAWVYMQYLAGLRDLGHDVYYLEDCGEESWVYNWETEALTTDINYPASFIQNCLEPIGFKDKWVYRAGSQIKGLSEENFLDLCSRADLLLIRAVPFVHWRVEYNRPKRRAFIDVDPGFTQIKLINGNKELTQTIKHCEHLFTFGQRIGADDCNIPTANRHWIKTLPPVSLNDWTNVNYGECLYFTSIMRLKGQEISHEGKSYGHKDKEFSKFINLPQHTAQQFLIALLGSDSKPLTNCGWKVIEGQVCTQTPWSYRNFIQNSRAEFGIAKQLYVETRGGWFSDRSVCYLASGRPILVQDTGLDDWIPTGEGIMSFRDLSEAVGGIETINSDYDRHRRAARQLAEQYFDAMVVLPPLLEAAMS